MLSINLLLVGFVGWSLAGEVAQGNKVSNDLNDLQKKINEVEGRNKDYADILSKLDTPGFVDREARLKLGYQKPGEQVLMLKDSVSAAVIAPDATDTAKLSNPQKWWRYFFYNK